MQPTAIPRIATGNDGLDEILGGGLPPNRMYLVQGDPGTGKTTLALAFLLEGARRGEPGTYITLSETEEEIRASAGSHGWSLDGLCVHEVGNTASDLAAAEPYTLFHPAEVELVEFTRKILEIVEQTRPVRLVLDSLAELRLLSADALRYRRQLLTLKRFFVGRPTTVLLLDESASDAARCHIESLLHGVICLERSWRELSDARHRLRVLKMRGIRFRGGYHDFTIETGGLAIYPRIRIADHHADFANEMATTGLPELDAILGGGLDRGSATLLIGPTGSGKSVLATQLAVAAAERGEHVALFVFDEVLEASFSRADGLRIGLREHVRSGRISARQLDPGELAAWQFGRAILQAVEHDGARLVVIDSLNGYLNAMSEDRDLDLALHEIFGCLSQLGVIAVSTMVRHDLVGERALVRLDISYLSDTVLLLSPFEFKGEMRKSISVVKRRRGPHENTIRELHIGPKGLRIGEALRGLHGVLTGVAVYAGEHAGLPEDDEPDEG
ncbi:circadian clock protein KaiC [Sorangium cellulosum]|uniref:non-specific serine/threonine protein kinase n=1 Tax=Sorangium cellulosum TaxID=56 RepID=A0A2L0EM26_SORCE|nr:ATPase domain-containing protein [Sorangium cellulosum]AUX40353.1 circadian clock protein KaiC [Sorangium cellulosum]